MIKTFEIEDQELEEKKFAKIWISLLKFKFSQILLGDKNATYLCSKIISTLKQTFFTITHSSTLQSCVKPYAIEIINVKKMYL